jgi:hypothetical protein
VTVLWHDAWKLQSAHLPGGASLSTFLGQQRKRRCWTENCWNTFPQQRIRLKKQCIACRVTSIPRQRIHKRFRSHGNEYPKHSNSEKRDNSTFERGDVYTVRRRFIAEEFARRIHSVRKTLRDQSLWNDLITEHKRRLEARHQCKIQTTVRGSLSRSQMCELL